MPEVPDVVVYARHLEASGLHREVRRTEVPDPRILAGISPRGLAYRLKGHRLTGTRRHGKYLFARVGGGGWLVLHFGMTGELLCREKGEAVPDYTRIALRLGGGRRIHYTSRRMLGQVGWTDDRDAFARERDLGPDILAEDLDAAALGAELASRNRPVKAALMDQSLVAGLGNVYVDETLFQAGVDPRTRTDALSPAALQDLVNDARRVARVAIRRGEGPRLRIDDLPAGWLLPRREKGARCPRGCGGTIARTEVGGRATYYCPRCQERRAGG